MEIYSFHSPVNILMNILYALGAVALGVVLLFMLRFGITKFIESKREKEKIPSKFKVIIIVFAILITAIPLIGCLGLGNLFIESVVYENDMRNGEGTTLTGDVDILSCEEYYYRDSFMGYKVVFCISGETLSPSNTFPSSVIEYFEGEEVLTVHYGIIKNDGLYVWSIKTAQD